ncbi:hypothetical protein CDIK_1698 [Cucumispora dikerogammari]|nr:hypothetical protein CDIK_1698 [Cucumispora dikerogammari]
MNDQLHAALQEIRAMKAQILDQLKILSKYKKITYEIPFPSNQFLEKYKEFHKVELIEIEKDVTKSILDSNLDTNPNIIKFANAHQKTLEPYIKNINQYMNESYLMNGSAPQKVKLLAPTLKQSLLEKVNRSFTEAELIEFNKIVNNMGFSVDYSEVGRIMSKTKTECVLMSFWCLEKTKNAPNTMKSSIKKSLVKTASQKEQAGKKYTKKIINKTSSVISMGTEDTNYIQTPASLIQQWSIDERRIFALYFPHFRRNWEKMNEFIPLKQNFEIEEYYHVYFKKLKPVEREFEQTLVNLPDQEGFNRFRRLSLVNIEQQNFNEFEMAGAIFISKKKG